MAGKGASLNPSEMLSGGRVPDGRYTIKSATAEVFDYQGKSAEVPAACFVFRAVDGTEHEQYYSAGDMQYLVPSEDKKMFVHPRGEDAKLSLNTNFGKFLKALGNAGFPQNELTSELTCLVNADIELVGAAQPKNQSGNESVLSLPTKYYGRAKAGAKAATRPTAAKPAAAATAPSTAQPAPASNGDVDEQAREQVLEALTSNDPKTGAPYGTLTRQQLGTKVLTSIVATKKEQPALFANMNAIRKSVQDPAWLAAQAEAGGWTVEGDAVTLG